VELLTKERAMKGLHRRHHRRATIGLVIGDLAVGLVGSGARVAFAEERRGGQRIESATVSCTLSSTDPHAVTSNMGHTVTVKMPDIRSSAAGTDLTNLTVTNSGSTPITVHWTEATSGTIAWQPAGRMTYTIGSPGNRLSTGLTLAPGAHHSYDGLGFQWTQLTNADTGRTATVSYTAQCSQADHQDRDDSRPYRREHRER
jgi:hypothetical protein